MSDREVIRCGKCKLVQFRGKREKCPRCGVGLGAVEEIHVVAPLRPAPAIVVGSTIGERIKAIRIRVGASQKDIAGRMGSPRTYISKLERGGCEPTVPLAIRVAAALQCDISELFQPFVPRVLGALGDPALVAFMAELYTYTGMLTSDEWVAVRRRAKYLAEAGSRVVIVNSAEKEAS